MQIPLVVFAAEGFERPFAIDGLIDGCTGKSNIGGVWQPGHQEVAQIPAGSAVGLVDHHKNVGPLVDVGRHITEFVDHGNDDPAVVVPEQFHQLSDPISVRHIMHL